MNKNVKVAHINWDDEVCKKCANHTQRGGCLVGPTDLEVSIEGVFCNSFRELMTLAETEMKATEFDGVPCVCGSYHFKRNYENKKLDNFECERCGRKYDISGELKINNQISMVATNG